MTDTKRRGPKVPGGRIRVPVRLNDEEYAVLQVLKQSGEPEAGVLLRGLEALWAKEGQR